MSIPAVEVGLDLDERVVRRHVAKLEAAGWLARAPWIWGEGSVVWLTAAGIEGAGLGGVRPVKSPPGATTIHHGVLVGWSAARVEHRGRMWKSARELAVEHERWAVTARCERGYTELLPDLAVWLKRSEPPVAVIAESGGRREDRQKMILEGWRDAILSGRYAGVHYHCASASVAHWIRRLAKKVWLTGPAFLAAAQMSAEEIAALSPAADDGDEPPVSNPDSSAEAAQPTRARRTPPAPAQIKHPEPPPEPQPDHPRRPPSESASTARSSAYPSQRCAAHGVAELGADVPTTCWTGVDVEIPGGDRGVEPHPCPVPLASMPAGDTLSQTASNPPKQDNNPRCVPPRSLARRSRCCPSYVK